MHLPSFCLYVQFVPISLGFYLIRIEMLRVPQLSKPGLKEAATKREKGIKKHHLSHSISLLQLLDEPLALFIKSPPQSQSRGPRKFKFRSPMYHSCITGFNFHCGLTEGQTKVVHLSYANRNHKSSKGSTFDRTYSLVRRSSRGKASLPDPFCKKHMWFSHTSCLQRWLC